MCRPPFPLPQGRRAIIPLPFPSCQSLLASAPFCSRGGGKCCCCFNRHLSGPALACPKGRSRRGGPGVCARACVLSPSPSCEFCKQGSTRTCLLVIPGWRMSPDYIAFQLFAKQLGAGGGGGGGKEEKSGRPASASLGCLFKCRGLRGGEGGAGFGVREIPGLLWQSLAARSARRSSSCMQLTERWGGRQTERE